MIKYFDIGELSNSQRNINLQKCINKYILLTFHVEIVRIADAKLLLGQFAGAMNVVQPTINNQE